MRLEGEIMTKQYESVYPFDVIYNDVSRLIEEGITKREYFAAMAMQGLLV